MYYFFGQNGIMSDEVEFTLAVQVCEASIPFKVMLNLFSTLYTGWLRADNMENIKKNIHHNDSRRHHGKHGRVRIPETG